MLSTKKNDAWSIRRIALFIAACIASPCCAPLYVPVVIALLGASPFALLLAQNLGWVYGGLTLLSVLGIALAYRWKRGRRNAAPPRNLEHQLIKTTNRS